MNSNRKLSVVLLAAASATLVVACGGGGGRGGSNPPPPAKQAPRIVGLANQTLPQDTTTGELPFQVSDADSDPAAVNVTAVSSDPSVIPADGIVLGGSGPNRTLTLTPAAEIFGSAMITIRAADPDGLTAEQVIRVQVDGVFVSFRNTVGEVFAAGENDDERSLSGFTFTADADDVPGAFDSLVQ